MPVLRMGNITRVGTIDYTDLVYTSDADDIAKYALRPGDLIFNRTNSREWVGKVAYYDGSIPAVYAGYLVRFRVILINPKYINYAMCTQYERNWCANVKTDGVNQSNINARKLKSFLVPVPPLAEQRRIVDALDKYLALVDGIERDRADLDGLLAQLKSKVLDLAVRGELVEHNPGDEPASELLARIHAEKLAMLERGELKPKDVKNDTVIFAGSDGLRYEKPADGKGEAKCIEKEIPFEVPEGWSWARLGVISNYGDASGVPIESIKNDAWIVDLEDIEKDTGRILAKLKKGERDSSSSKRPFKSGQILYSKLRPYLNKVLIADEDGFCTSEIMPIALYDNMAPDYIRRCLMSPYFLAYANQCAYGCKMPRLSTSDGKKALISIPPLVEQHRIVEAIEAAFDITNL